MEVYPLTSEAFRKRLAHSIENDPALRVTFNELMEKEENQRKNNRKFHNSRHG